MKRDWVCVFLVGFLMTSGCSSKPPLLKHKGQITKGGAEFIPEDEDVIAQIALVPISPDGSPPRSWYAVVVDQQTGRFYASGGHLEGVPPGKYRAVVQLKRDRKDTLQGKYNESHSPFIVDIDQDSEEIEIDLDTQPL